MWGLSTLDLGRSAHPHRQRTNPAGFINHINNVAIVGAGGQIGKSFAQALVKTGKHVVAAITRTGSTNKLPSGVKSAAVQYDDESSFIQGLTGQEFLIITLALSAPEDTHSKLVHAAAKAGVRYVIANTYGVDVYSKKGLCNDLPVGQKIVENIKGAENAGLTWFALFTGPWYEYSLTFDPELLSLDGKNRTATLYDDGKTPINFTTMPQVARAVAALLSLKKLPEDEHDTSVTLAQFANNPVYVSSFHVIQEGILNSVKRITNTEHLEWRVAHQPTQERYREGMKLIEEGNPAGFGKAIFARALYPNGDGGTFDTANDLLGLPKEDLDEATRAAIEQA